MNEVLTALSVTALFLCLLIGISVAVWKGQTTQDRWTHEASDCACGHNYYDHMHHTNESPCTMMMCSCQRYERKENHS